MEQKQDSLDMKLDGLMKVIPVHSEYVGIIPSLKCAGFCTMGTVGAIPKPLILRDLWQVGRTQIAIARDRTDCTFV